MDACEIRAKCICLGWFSLHFIDLMVLFGFYTVVEYISGKALEVVSILDGDLH